MRLQASYRSAITELLTRLALLLIGSLLSLPMWFDRLKLRRSLEDHLGGRNNLSTFLLFMFKTAA